MNFPRMRECTKCGDCCTAATATDKEARRIARYVAEHGIAWQEHVNPLTCGFLRRDGEAFRCAVYPVRPLVCQMFGVVKEMPCSFFPEAARVSFTANRAVHEGFMSPDDRTLAAYFSDDPNRQADALRDYIVDGTQHTDLIQLIEVGS